MGICCVAMVYYLIYFLPVMGEHILSRGDYTLSFARHKKARPIIVVMADLILIIIPDRQQRVEEALR